MDWITTNTMRMNGLVLGVTSVGLNFCRYPPRYRFAEIFLVPRSDLSPSFEGGFLEIGY